MAVLRGELETLAIRLYSVHITHNEIDLYGPCWVFTLTGLDIGPAPIDVNACTRTV